MKKLFALTLSLLLALSLVACGGDAADDTANTDDGTVAEATAGEGDDVAASPAVATFDYSTEITVVSREDGSGTRGAFVELFEIEEKDENDEKVDRTTVEANITNSTSVMMATVAGDEYAIGYISLGSLDDTVKAVQIDGAEATVANIKDGSYSVSRPFNIATAAEVDEVTGDFIDFIMSSEGQAVIEDNGYIATDDAAEAYAGSAPAGKITISGSSSVTPVMEKLVEAYASVNPDAEIELQQSDSSTGMQDAIDGNSQIGMASRELKDSELEAGLVDTVIAIDGIAVILNNDSPIDNLTSGQVKSIFVGETYDWSDFE